MFKKIIIITMFSSLLIGLTACNTTSLNKVLNNTLNKNILKEVVESNEVKNIIESSANEKDSNKEKENVIESTNNKFSTKIEQITYITDKLYEMKKENILFSPMSLDIALGMVELGAENESKKSIDSFLMKDNFNQYIKEYINENNYYHTAENQFDNNSAYKINNSIVFNNKLNWKEEYINKTKEYYNAEIYKEDFSDTAKIANKVNSWVKEKTYDMIDKIIEPSNLTNDTRIILTNTIYFEDNWKDRWGEARDQYEFKNIDGTISNPNIISNSFDGEYYYENDKAVGFSSSYVNGFKFVGILPKEEGNFNLSDLDIEGLLESKNKSYKINAFMPEFTYDFKENITNILKEICPNMFLSTDYKLITEDEPLAIDTILQATKIELNKDGTKASAATSIMVKFATALQPMKEIKEIKIDRPFAYLIFDKNDNIVFIGKITNLE